MTQTIVAVTVTAPKRAHVASRVAQCGDTYRYEKHMEHRGTTSILVGCLCRRGHGPTHVPWRGWITTNEAKMTITDIPAPLSSYTPLTDAEIAAQETQETQDAQVLTLAQVGVTVPAQRSQPVAA